MHGPLCREISTRPIGIMTRPRPQIRHTLVFNGLLIMGCVVALGACQANMQHVDIEQEAEIIRQTHAAWADAEVAGDMAAALSYLWDDAILQPPDAAPLTSRAAVTAFYEAMFELPMVSMILESPKVSVAASGDLAAIWGNLIFTLARQDGNAVDTLKFMAVYEKRGGEKWKVAANSWSANSPLPEG